LHHQKSDYRIVGYPFDSNYVQGNRVAGENGFAISNLMKLTPLVKRYSQKNGDRLGPLPVLDGGEKLNLAGQNKPEVKTVMKT
jgi:hypothetical protein